MGRRIAMFIDHANLFSSYKSMGFTIDYEKLIKYIEIEFTGNIEIKSFYFAYPEKNTRSYDVNGIHKLATFLKKGLGFHIKKKPLKRIELRDETGSILHTVDGKVAYKEKGNLDVELVMDVMQTYNYFDTMILFSGDSDFEPLSRFLIWKGKKVYVFSTKGNISHELIYGSSGYFDIADIPDIRGNPLKNRNENP